MKNIYLQSMKIASILLICLGSNEAIFASSCTKTVVFVRHGEKNGSEAKGQINCQGLNRALALPAVLQSLYGTPVAIYATNPEVTVSESGGCYPYNRPLSTINPTAIADQIPALSPFGVGNYRLPNTQPSSTISTADTPDPRTDYLQISGPTAAGSCRAGTSSGDMELAKEILNNSSYCDHTVFVAWDHANIPIVAYSFYKLLGLDPTNAIPIWPYAPCLYSYCTPGTSNPTYNFDTIYTVTIDQSTPSISIKLGREHLDGQSKMCPLPMRKI